MAQGQTQPSQIEPQNKPRNGDRARYERSAQQYGHTGKTAVKISMSQLAAAAGLFSAGKTGEHTLQAASRFGNQAMLGLAESGKNLKVGINVSAGVLSGEAPPDFDQNAPISELEPNAPFSPTAPPDFSASAPAADIQAVGAAAGGYL